MKKIIQLHKFFPTMSLMLMIIILFCFTDINAQRKKTIQKKRILPCILEVKDSPTIRNISLRMPRVDFLKMFPSAEYVESLSNIELSNLRYDVDVSENKNFDGSNVEISFVWFVDNQLASIGFNYPSFEPISVKNFVRQASNLFNLPVNSWQNTDGMSNPQTLRCKDFEIMIGREEFRAGIGNPYMILSDKIADEKIEKRRKEIQEKEKVEQIKKEREKRIFKP